jgi:flavin-dependent dehydrogenase
MTDVLIVGAGPSGSVAAALLADKGYDVLVLERQRFPRFSIGESLLANSMQLLTEAGMAETVMRQGFQFKNGAAFVCGEAYSDFNFVDKVTAGCPFTFQVPRADFDQALIDEAARRGARVHYETEITACDVSGARPRLTARDASGEHIHEPRFVLDGSGFGRTLPRLLDLEKPSSFPVRAALFCHVKDNIVAGEFDRQKIRVGINPENRDIWSWLIPFSNGNSSLGVVASREQHARYPGSNEQRLWAMIADEPPLKTLLSGAYAVRPVGEIVGYAANVKSLHGPGYALLGNAAEFLDPVFSSGVTIAIQSATFAAALVDRELRGETVDWEREFTERLMFGVETFRTFVTGWYNLSLQDVIFAPNKDPKVHAMICSVLAGYVWDPANPYNGPQSSRRLAALAEICRAQTR